MISRLHDKLGTAGLIVAVVALVAALAGTAFAASGGLTSKQKKQVEGIAKKFAGKNGAPGPQGNPGAAGAAGKDGTNGTNGAPGANGKSVVASPASGAECPEGGTKFEVEGSGVSHKVCNGEEGLEGPSGPAGEPWTPNNELPENATETGAWGFAGKFAPAAAPIVPISFPIPLGSSLGSSAVHLINSNGKELRINETNGSKEESTPTKCGSALSPAGTVANPAAAAGNLCVYSEYNLSIQGPNTFMGSNLIHTPASECEGLACLAAFGGPGAGSSASGALIGVGIEAEEIARAWGTWAVTAGP